MRGALVVDHDAVDRCCGQPAVDGHHRDAALGQHLDAGLLRRGWREQGSGHLLCRGHLEVAGLFGQVLICVGEHDGVSRELRLVFGAPHDGSEERVGDVRDDDAEHHRRPGAEATGRAVPAIAELGHRAEYPAPQVRADILLPVQDPRHGRRGHQRHRGNVANGRRHPSPHLPGHGPPGRVIAAPQTPAVARPSPGEGLTPFAYGPTVIEIVL